MSVVATTNFAKQTALIGVLLNSCISLGRTTSLHTASSDPWTRYLTLWSLSPAFCDFHHPDPLIQHISICPGPQGHTTYDTRHRDARFYPLRPVVSIPPAGAQAASGSPRCWTACQKARRCRSGFPLWNEEPPQPSASSTKEDKTLHSDLLEIQDLKSTLLLPNAEWALKWL